MFAVLLKKRPVEPQMYSGTWAASETLVCFLLQKNSCSVEGGQMMRVYLLQGKHLVTFSVGVFDYFISF